MKKQLYIFTNTEHLFDTYHILTQEKDKELIEKYMFSEELQKKEFVNLEVCILSDETPVQKLEGADYIALHHSVQNIDESDWRKENKGAMVIDFSHSSKAGEFYKDIIPKVLDSSLTLEDVHKHFPSSLELSLNLLHDIYSGIPKSDFNKTFYKDIIENSGITKELDALDDNWCYSKIDKDTLVFFRDKLLTYAIQTKNEK